MLETQFGFTDGDAVRLVSGGPVMMVRNDRDDGLISCMWFDGKRLVTDSFPCAGLRRVGYVRRALARLLCRGC